MYSRLLRSIRRQPPDGSSQRHSLFELWLRGKYQTNEIWPEFCRIYKNIMFQRILSGQIRLPLLSFRISWNPLFEKKLINRNNGILSIKVSENWDKSNETKQQLMKKIFLTNNIFLLKSIVIPLPQIPWNKIKIDPIKASKDSLLDESIYIPVLMKRITLWKTFDIFFSPSHSSSQLWEPQY